MSRVPVFFGKCGHCCGKVVGACAAPHPDIPAYKIDGLVCENCGSWAAPPVLQMVDRRRVGRATEPEPRKKK